MHACAYIPTQLMNTQERASIAHTFTLGSSTYNCIDHAFPVQRQCLSLLLSQIKFTQTDFLRGVSLTWLSSSKTINLKGPSPGPIANIDYMLEVVRRRSGTILPQYCSLKKILFIIRTDTRYWTASYQNRQVESFYTTADTPEASASEIPSLPFPMHRWVEWPPNGCVTSPSPH